MATVVRRSPAPLLQTATPLEVDEVASVDFATAENDVATAENDATTAENDVTTAENDVTSVEDVVDASVEKEQDERKDSGAQEQA